MPKSMDRIYFRSRADWRAWLAANHDESDGVWLIIYKKHTGRPTLDYEELVEEALCFGWIDSTVRRLDEDRFLRKLTPRKPVSEWSDSNRRRVDRLVARGLMTAAGLAKVEAAKAAGRWRTPERPRVSPEMPAALAQALAADRKAREFFESLAPSYRRQYIGWIAVARKPETRERRIAEAMILLGQGKKLGMK